MHGEDEERRLGSRRIGRVLKRSHSVIREELKPVSIQNFKINVTAKGTSIVKSIPLNTEMTAYSFPTNFVMIGRVVSIDVAPPAAIGAIFPKYFASIGVMSRVMISREIFDIKATTPSASPLIWLINILERL